MTPTPAPRAIVDAAAGKGADCFHGNFGGERPVRFRAAISSNRTFVHEASDGSYAPQYLPFSPIVI